TNLLRLDDQHRENFGKVLDLLHAPRINSTAAASDPASVTAALNGLIYAATLNPSLMVLNEDPDLLRRHQAADSRREGNSWIFTPAALSRQSEALGTHFSGSFA